MPDIGIPRRTHSVSLKLSNREIETLNPGDSGVALDRLSADHVILMRFAMAGGTPIAPPLSPDFASPRGLSAAVGTPIATDRL